MILVGWLVGLEHKFYFPFHIWDVILPIDELIFFRGVGQPPTRIGWFTWENPSEKRRLVGLFHGKSEEDGCFFRVTPMKYRMAPYNGDI